MSSKRGHVPRSVPLPSAQRLPQSPQSYDRAKQFGNVGSCSGSPLQPGSVLVGKSVERRASAVRIERDSRDGGTFPHVEEWGSVMLAGPTSPIDRGIGGTARTRTSQSTTTLPQINVEGNLHGRQSSRSQLAAARQPRPSALSLNSSKLDGLDARKPAGTNGTTAWGGGKRSAEYESVPAVPPLGVRSSGAHLNAPPPPPLGEMDSFACSSRSASFHSSDFGYDYGFAFEDPLADALPSGSSNAFPSSQPRLGGEFRDAGRDASLASGYQDERGNWEAQSEVDEEAFHAANRDSGGLDYALNVVSGPSLTRSDEPLSRDNKRVEAYRFSMAPIAEAETSSYPAEFVKHTVVGGRILVETVRRAHLDEVAEEHKLFYYSEFLEDRRNEGKRKVTTRELSLEDRRRLCNNYRSIVPRVAEWSPGPTPKRTRGTFTAEDGDVEVPQCSECGIDHVEWACNTCAAAFFCSKCINATFKHHDARHSYTYIHRLEDVYSATPPNGKENDSPNPTAEKTVSLLSLAAYDVFYPQCDHGLHPIRESEVVYVCDLCEAVVCAACYESYRGPKIHAHPLRLVQHRCIADTHMETWRIGERLTKDKREIVNNYVLTKELGSGTFAKVYLAEHVITRAQYAVKVLRLDSNEPLLRPIQSEITAIVRADEQSVPWRPMLDAHSDTSSEVGASPRSRSFLIKSPLWDDDDAGNCSFVSKMDDTAPAKKRLPYPPTSIMGQLQGSQVNMRSFSRRSFTGNSGNNVLRRLRGERMFAYNGKTYETEGTTEKNVIFDDHEKGAPKSSAFTPLANALREIAVMFEFQDDPRLVRLHEVCFDPRQEKLYLIMEWCANGVVHALNGGGLELEKVRKYGRDLRDILLALHDKSLFHLDVKPSNCLLDSHDQIKLADFGTITGNPTPTLGQGTIGYQCPDVLLNKPTTARMMDSWAFGMSLYEMATGELPVPLNPALIRDWAATGTEVEFDEFIASDLKDLLKKLLARNPEERFLLDDVKNHPFFAQPADWRGLKVMKAFSAYKSDTTEMDMVNNMLAKSLIEYRYRMEFQTRWNNANKARNSSKCLVEGKGKTPFEKGVRAEEDLNRAFMLSGATMYADACKKLRDWEEKKDKDAKKKKISMSEILREPHIPAGAKHRKENTVSYLSPNNASRRLRETLRVAELEGGTEAEARSFVGRLTTPQIVSLNNCQLTSFVKLNTCELRELYLINNKLTEFPIAALAAKKLKTLNLKHNLITTIPLYELVKHEHLEQLDLSFNNISEIPYNNVLNALCFKSAVSIHLNNNPLVRFPPFFDWICAGTITLPDSPFLISALDSVLLPKRLQWEDPPKASSSEKNAEASGDKSQNPSSPVSWVDYGPVRVLPPLNLFYLPMIGRWKSKCNRECMELYRIRYVIFLDAFGGLIPQQTYVRIIKNKGQKDEREENELKEYINGRRIWQRTSDVSQVHPDDDLDDESPSRADVRPELLSDSVLDYVTRYDFVPVISTAHLQSAEELENFMHTSVATALKSRKRGSVLVVSPRFKAEYTWLIHFLTLFIRHSLNLSYMDASYLLLKHKVIQRVFSL